ncbi:MAG: hypothetical protein ABI675_28085 [Chitinophagaceae bacterium]
MDSSPHYTGFITNLEQRLRSHNEPGNDWAAKYWPWKIGLYQRIYNKDRSYALAYCKAGQTRTVANYLKRIFTLISASIIVS